MAAITKTYKFQVQSSTPKFSPDYLADNTTVAGGWGWSVSPTPWLARFGREFAAAVDMDGRLWLTTPLITLLSINRSTLSIHHDGHQFYQISKVAIQDAANLNRYARRNEHEAQVQSRNAGMLGWLLWLS
jgi:hypothetical protein